MKRHSIGSSVVVLCGGILMLFMLASCKQAKVVEQPLETGQVQTEQTIVLAPGPHPEAALTVPPVSRQNEQVLLVYRHATQAMHRPMGSTPIFSAFSPMVRGKSLGVAYISAPLEAKLR